ncbi:MAG: hypothetical protein ACREDV_05100 [Methylocella sp.]
MAAPRLEVELVVCDEDVGKLAASARPRTEALGRVERARMLLAIGTIQWRKSCVFTERSRC